MKGVVPCTPWGLIGTEPKINKMREGIVIYLSRYQISSSTHAWGLYQYVVALQVLVRNVVDSMKMVCSGCIADKNTDLRIIIILFFWCAY